MPIQNIAPKVAQKLSKSGILFIDVREKNETECFKYDLDGIIYLPLSEFDKKFTEYLPANRHTEMILACQAGGRSMMAASFLFQHGYIALYNLKGGISQWEADGLPIKRQYLS